jgi:hypothetical protein
MVALSDADKSRARFHLGYNSIEGIPAQDIAQIEESMNEIRDNYAKQRVITQLDRCDRAFTRTEMSEEPKTSAELYIGDINRAVSRFDLGEAERRWWQNYLDETNILAQLLWAPNYWEPEALRYRTERTGAEYIMAVPGPADTAVGSNIYETLRSAGGFGLPAF